MRKGATSLCITPRSVRIYFFNELKDFWAKTASFWYIIAEKVKKLSINVQFL